MGVNTDVFHLLAIRKRKRSVKLSRLVNKSFGLRFLANPFIEFLIQCDAVVPVFFVDLAVCKDSIVVVNKSPLAKAKAIFRNLKQSNKLHDPVLIVPTIRGIFPVIKMDMKKASANAEASFSDGAQYGSRTRSCSVHSRMCSPFHQLRRAEIL